VAGAFAGEHYFLFEDSKATQGGTRLVHGETYLGWMKWIFVLPGMNGYAHDLFNGLTVDLKTRVEGLKAEGRL
jgi:hypothetical protein